MYLNKPFTTSTQLRKMAKKYRIPLTSILHKDQLKHITPKAGQSFIINMENSNGIQGGTHWVALKMEKNDNPVYFDSFNMPPPCSIMDFCKRYSNKPPIYGDKQIQSIRSGYCGQYVIYFLIFMYYYKGSARDRYQKFLDEFHDGSKRR